MLLLLPVSARISAQLIICVCVHQIHSHQRSLGLALYFVVLLRVLMSEEVRPSQASRKEYGRLQGSTDRRVEACFSEDRLVGYDDQVEKLFDSTVKLGVESVLGRWRTMKEYLDGQPGLREKHPVLADVTQTIGVEVWTLWRNVKCFGQRIVLFSAKVKQKVQETRDKGKRKGKSIKRQEAGKRKAGPLRSWNRDVEEARSVLRRAGYQGSLTLKKGGVLYAKVEEIRQDKFDQVCIGESTPSSSK